MYHATQCLNTNPTKILLSMTETTKLIK